MTTVDHIINEGTDDRRFYKYMTRSIGRIALKKRTLRWSTPRTLNDPFDIQFDLNIDQNLDRELVKQLASAKSWDAYINPEQTLADNDLGRAIRLLRENVPGMSREEWDAESDIYDECINILERILPGFQDELRSLRASTKILCLSEIPDHNLMWSYYSEGHKGIVLSFKSAKGCDSPWRVGKRVQYVDSMPLLFDEHSMSDILSGRKSMDGAEIMDRMIFTKSADWAHEREWRINTGDGRYPDADYEEVPFHTDELDAVIFGCKCLDHNRLEIQKIVKRLYPNTLFLMAVQNPRDFKLKIEPIPAASRGVFD